MDFKLVLLLSALGLACAASIQDPFIHDSVEDQIAMESGPQQSVVVAPPHLQEGGKPTPAGSDAPPADDADAEAAADASADASADESDAKKPGVPFTVILNDESAEVAPQLAPFGQTFGGFALRRPALPPALTQMSLLSRLQSQLQYPALNGFGGAPIIVLQPIIVPVPMASGEGEKQPNALTEETLSSLFRRQPIQPRPVTLMDFLQRGYFAY